MRVFGAQIVAVGRSITVSIRVGYAASALAGCCLIPIVWTSVVAIEGFIAIGIHIGHAAAA